MKKVLFIALSSCAFVFVSCAQTPKKQVVNNQQQKVIEETVVVEETKENVGEFVEEIVPEIMYDNLADAWEFHEITLRTPKDGYLMHIADQEVGFIHLLVANYTFNKDGMLIFSDKYINNIGIKNASWSLNENKELSITYFFTEDSKFNEGNTNKEETLVFSIEILDNENLTINWNDMFIVNLKAD